MKNKYPELEYITKNIFEKCKIKITHVVSELESQDYLALNFKLNGCLAKFRKAKITPTKTGQFVTLWKRNTIGITEPFSIFDELDYYIIATKQNEKFGLFIFPKTVLYENKILSDNFIIGKRGFRVYPNWDLPESKQAKKTQLWQLNYFFNITDSAVFDFEEIKKILL